MSEPNPYAPPAARVADVSSNVADDEIPFFAVSVRKLTVLSICTFGIYQVYWFYKHWQRVRERGESVLPVMRAIFGIFFCYALFSRVRDYDHPNVRSETLAAGGLALGWVVLQLVANLPNPFYLLTFASVVFLVPVQSRINRINEEVAPDHDPNSRFSGWNWFGIVIGGLLFLLAIIGSTLPEGDA